MQAIRSRDSRCLHHENLHLPKEQLRMWMRNHHGRARLCKHLEAALQWALLCPWWVPWGVGMVVGRRSLRNPTVTCNQIVFLNRGRGCFAAREVSCGGLRQAAASAANGRFVGCRTRRMLGCSEAGRRCRKDSLILRWQLDQSSNGKGYQEGGVWKGSTSASVASAFRLACDGSRKNVARGQG